MREMIRRQRLSRASIGIGKAFHKAYPGKALELSGFRDWIIPVVFDKVWSLLCVEQHTCFIGACSQEEIVAYKRDTVQTNILCLSLYV